MTAKQTRLDKDTTKPSTTQPGDGPADTTDAAERASSVTPQPGPESLKVGTVNAVQPVPQDEEPARDGKKDRWEEYEAVKPDGSSVKVKHNIDTGETKLA